VPSRRPRPRRESRRAVRRMSVGARTRRRRARPMKT
jgi:hypothetical protein